MSNPLLKQAGRGIAQQPQGVGGGMNPMQFIQSFNQFRRGFNGNASQIISEAVSSGRVSQAQVNSAVQQAQQIAKMFSLR